jgi:hypothetical protein
MKSLLVLFLVGGSMAIADDQFTARDKTWTRQFMQRLNAQEHAQQDYRDRLISEGIERRLNLPQGSISYAKGQDTTAHPPYYTSADGSITCVDDGEIRCVNEATGKRVGRLSEGEMNEIRRRSPQNTFFRKLFAAAHRGERKGRATHTNHNNDQ